jgi:hypothetical protein
MAMKKRFKFFLLARVHLGSERVPGVSIIRLISFVTDICQNKLERLTTPGFSG